MATEKTPEKQASQQIHLRYEQTMATYASQFVLNATGEEIIINFSSGSIPDPRTGENHLPIHTRIAISTAAARRLVNLLNQALSASEQTKTVTTGTAQLPSLKN
jgi:hypothetical protein